MAIDLTSAKKKKAELMKTSTTKKATEERTKTNVLNDKMLKLKSLMNEFHNDDTSYMQQFSKMDSNDYRPTGLLTFDHIIFGKGGIRFPSKILLFGKAHIGKTSLLHAFISNYLGTHKESMGAYLDLDKVVDDEYVTNTHKITGNKADRFVYMRCDSAEKALEMFEKSMEAEIFDILVADPWNMIARSDDMKKTGANLVGKTKMADRAGINLDFFRTKSNLIDKSKTSFWFALHETMNQMGTSGFAGGSALEGSMEVILRMFKPFKPMFNTSDDMVIPIHIQVKKNKLYGNKDEKYEIYFHKEKGYLSEYDKFSFLNYCGVIKKKGTRVYIDHPSLGDEKTFYFSQWETFYEKYKDNILDICDEQIRERKNRKGKEDGEREVNDLGFDS